MRRHIKSLPLQSQQMVFIFRFFRQPFPIYVKTSVNHRAVKYNDGPTKEMKAFENYQRPFAKSFVPVLQHYHLKGQM